MGNEMGNSNTTSAPNEEDNASEADDKKALNEEVSSKNMEEEHQKIYAAETKSDDGLALNETSKGDNTVVGDGEKGENQRMASDNDDAIIEAGKVIVEEDSHHADDENVEEKATENDSSKGDTIGDVVIVENQMDPLDEADDDEYGDHQNDLSTGAEIVQEKDERIDFDDDRTNELQDRTQEETYENDETGEEENAKDLVLDDLDDQSSVKYCFSDSGHQITEIIQVEDSSSDGLEDKGGENCKTLSNLSLESCEEYEKQIDLSNDHHLHKESSIKQEEENTIVLASNDVELEESSQIHSSHDEFDEILKQPSLQRSEDERENGDESEITDNVADHSLDSSPESDMVDKQLDSNIGNMFKDLQQERKLNQGGSEMARSQDSEAGFINGEENIVLVCDVLSETDQNEKLKVTEKNGHQFDVCIKINTTSGQKESQTLQNSLVHQEAYLDSSNLTMSELDITTSEANQSGEQLLDKPVFANGGCYEVMESMTSRYSTESNPENPNNSCLMQKSPSFNLNLRIESTKEESDHIPSIIHQGKAATEEIPVEEEKIVTMERSYSGKFHAAPFLGLLKEEEEAHILVMPKKQENQEEEEEEAHILVKKEVKEKRKARTSLFGSFLCCMTLRN